MTGNPRFPAVFAVLVLLAVSTFAQTGPQSGTSYASGTVVDVDAGRGRLQIESDNDRSRVTIESDAISTTYHGFGTMIAGKPEIFTGSKGLSNIRLGDRIRVDGSSRTPGVVTAASITLVGREVAANPVGVGQTRSQTNIATPTDDRPSGTVTVTAGTVEGTIRQINLNEGRLVIQTAQRRMMTVRMYRNTPVMYRGERFTISNLEVGDTIRVESDARDAEANEISARRIEVTRSVQETEGAGGTSGLVTMIDGRVTRTESGLDYAYIDDERGEIRVDMSQAEDAQGKRIHARDLRVGDHVEISGNYNRVGDIFAASTVRYSTGVSREAEVDEVLRYGVVTITGTVTETLEDSPTLALRDRASSRTLRVWVTEDFVIRNKSGTTATAESLRLNDTILVKAFRDSGGNLIAQTIRLRNR